MKTLGEEEFNPGWDKQKKTRCTQSKMIENFYMRFFNFQGSYIRIVNLYSSWNPQNQNDVFLTTLSIGREVGKMLRILFDFHLTDESRQKVMETHFIQW